MATRLAALVRRMRRDEPAGSSDADLLARFVRNRDEAAFELLVWRHGAMVLSACRRILRHTEDAEDAFQAVFLVLARKARSVARGVALPGWLHRVAVRIALRHATARRSFAPLEVEPAIVPANPAIQSETIGILDEEIDRLSERVRAAVVMCYLEGLSAAEAGQRLGCPTGTVESRLAAARKNLRERLSRRGVTLPVGVLAMVVSQGVLAPEAVAKLTRTCAAFSRGDVVANETSVQLAKGALTMWQTRTVAGTILVVTLLALGAGFGWANWPASKAEPQAAALPEAPPQAKDDAPPANDAWPFARRTQRVGGALIGVTQDGQSLIVRDGQWVYGLDLTEKSGRNSLSFQVSSANNINDAAVSRDGKLVATAEGIHGVKLRDAKTGEIVAALWPSGKLPSERVAFTPDGKHLVAFGTRRDDPTRVGKGAKGGVFGGEFPKEANQIKVHAQATVWDIATHKEVGQVVETTTVDRIVENGPTVPGHWLSENGRFVLKSQNLVGERKAFGSKRSFEGERVGFRFSVFDTLTGKSTEPVEVKDAKLHISAPHAISPDGKTVVAVNESNLHELRLLDAATGKVRVRLSAHLRPVKCFIFSPDGKYFAAASGIVSRDNPELAAPSEVVIWETATGKELARLTDKESIRDYTALAFSPDGKFIVAQDGEEVYSLWGHPPEAKEVAVKPPATSKDPPASATGVPERFQALFQTLAAEGVSDERRVEGVFLAALGRLPSEVEKQTLAAQFARQTDKPAALRDLLNTLVATAEFKAHAEALGKLAK